MQSNKLGLDQILEGLERASSDDDIEGIFLNISGAGAYPSTLEDIRAGLEAFKDLESGLWLGLRECLKRDIT